MYLDKSEHWQRYKIYFFYFFYLTKSRRVVDHIRQVASIAEGRSFSRKRRKIRLVASPRVLSAEDGVRFVFYLFLHCCVRRKRFNSRTKRLGRRIGCRPHRSPSVGKTGEGSSSRVGWGGCRPVRKLSHARVPPNRR